MKVQPIEFDDTFLGYTSVEKDKRTMFVTDSSPTRRRKSNAFLLPSSNQEMLDSFKSELVNDDTVLALINTIVCGVTILQHNLYFENNYEFTDFITNLRVIILVLSLSSILWVIRRYQVRLALMLGRYQVSISDNLMTTGLYKPMMVEIFMVFLVAIPYFDFTFSVEMLGFTVEYSLSALLTFVSMLRLYVILRLFGHYSEYTQVKAQKICNKHAVKADAYFALKCYIQHSPFIGIAAFFLFMSTFTAIGMKLCEQPDREIEGISAESSLRSFWDNMWVIFYTTTTVGYGNLYPMTHLGRGICIIACILGNMYLGMLVVTIHQKMKLDEGQNLSYAWISRRYYSKDIKKYARIVIRKAATLYFLSLKWKSKTICRIKANGIVIYKKKLLKNDLHSLNEEQFKTKLRIYREFRKAIVSFKNLRRASREAGKSEIDILYEFEDAVRIDFPKLVKGIKRKVSREDVEISETFAKCLEPLASKSSQVKDFSKLVKKKVSHALRRRTTAMMNTSSENIRSSNRSLTNPSII